MTIELTASNNKVIVSHVAFIKLVKLGCWFKLRWTNTGVNEILMSKWYEGQWVAHDN